MPTAREVLKDVVAEIRALKKKKIEGVGFTMIDDMKLKRLFEEQAELVQKIERAG